MYSSDRIRSAVCCGADKTAVYFYIWHPKKGLPFCQQIATNVQAILFRQAFICKYVQSNLVIRNFMVTLKLFLNAKSSLSL